MYRFVQNIFHFDNYSELPLDVPAEKHVGPYAQRLFFFLSYCNQNLKVVTNFSKTAQYKLSAVLQMLLAEREAG
jgi:hypothetical protein